jgi:transcriptional regulator with XRE-family HTH domain
LENQKADDVDVVVGSLVKARRIELGLTQMHLADALGVTFQQIQKYEAGTNRLSAASLWRLAHYLEVPPERLMPSTEPSEGVSQALDLWAGPEAQELLSWFVQIDDPRLRLGIIDVARAFAHPNKENG